jgi:hypothetical protein
MSTAQFYSKISTAPDMEYVMASESAMASKSATKSSTAHATSASCTIPHRRALCTIAHSHGYIFVKKLKKTPPQPDFTKTEEWLMHHEALVRICGMPVDLTNLVRV